MLRLLLPWTLIAPVIWTTAVHADPPFGGTVYVEPDIITAQDPSTFRGLTYDGAARLDRWDHRFETKMDEPIVPADFHRFTATFRGGKTMQLEVNTEFGSAAKAGRVAEIYAFIAGQMPAVMRKNMLSIVVHKTGDDWSAGPDGEIVIHHGNYAGELADGALEESMFHEAVHTSIDMHVEGRRTWVRAAKADGTFISEYARDSGGGEDVAETFLLYYAWALRRDRMDPDDLQVIEDTIPNRLAFFQKTYPAAKLGL